MANFDFVTDSKLSEGSYTSNNKPNTASINGWMPLEVDWGAYTPSDTFGAQLYSKDGLYKVAFRGTEGNLADWAQNLRYGTFLWSKEFEDAVVFMANAIKQIAAEQRVSIERAAQLLSTTGHSQGGFLSELSAVLFGVKGTSLDGMGATGVAAQFRTKFTQIMVREGVPTLAVEHMVRPEDFGTRIYTAVGRLGVHAGDTDGAWSWSLSKVIAALNPAMAGPVLMGGLLAHRISDIVANEELRVKDPVWRLIGDAGDLNDASRLANELAGDWASIKVAWAGDGSMALPDTAVANALIEDFLKPHAGERIQRWQDDIHKTLRIELANGDSLLLYEDGRVLKTTTSGAVAAQTMYDKTGQASMRSGIQLDELGNALVTRSGTGFSNTYVVDPMGHVTSGIDQTFDAQQNLLAQTVYRRNDDHTVSIDRYNGKKELVSQTTKNTFDDGSSIEIKTEAGQQYLRATDTEQQTSDWKNLSTGQTQTQEFYQKQMYGDMAAFLSATRAGDKTSQVLYGAKLWLDNQQRLGQTDPDLSKMQTGVSAALAVAGIVNALGTLGDGDANDTAKLAGTVGLVSSANSLYTLANSGSSYLSASSLGMLNVIGGLMAINNLKDLDQMVATGHYGSAVSTVYGAYVGGSAIAAGAAAAAEGGSFFVAAGESAAAAGPYAVYVVAAAIVLDAIFGDDYDPPPPPPVGWAEFTHGTLGRLQVSYHGSTPDGQDMPGDKALGQSLLERDLGRVATQIDAFLAEANKTNADIDRQLVVVSSRLPKIILQSWPAYSGNGESNYYYLAEMTHPQTGQKYYANVARQDLARDTTSDSGNLSQYLGLMIAPEALVQRWQAEHLAAKFGPDESQWQTEGQWAMAQSPIEQQRSALTQAYQAAHRELQTLKETQISLSEDGLRLESAGNAPTTQAQAKVDAAFEALVAFSTVHPLGFVSTEADAQGHHSQGINAQARAMVVDAMTQANLASLQASDPEAWQAAWSRAREATQWVAATDAMLGIDLKTLKFNLADGSTLQRQGCRIASNAFTYLHAA